MISNFRVHSFHTALPGQGSGGPTAVTLLRCPPSAAQRWGPSVSSPLYARRWSMAFNTQHVALKTRWQVTEGDCVRTWHRVGTSLRHRALCLRWPESVLTSVLKGLVRDISNTLREKSSWWQAWEAVRAEEAADLPANEVGGNSLSDCLCSYEPRKEHAFRLVSSSLKYDGFLRMWTGQERGSNSVSALVIGRTENSKQKT